MSIIFAATNGFLDNVQVKYIKSFENGLFPFIEEQYADIPHTIENQKDLSPELQETMKKAVAAYKDKFVGENKDALDVVV